MTVKVVITETWYVETEADNIDAKYTRKHGVMESQYVARTESPVTISDYLAEIDRVKRERRIEANRKNSNLPPKPGKMARGRPRKVNDE